MWTEPASIKTLSPAQIATSFPKSTVGIGFTVTSTSSVAVQLPSVTVTE